jgi:DNA-binding NtrC family response regulator
MPGKPHLLWIGSGRLEADELEWRRRLGDVARLTAAPFPEAVDRLRDSGADLVLANFPIPDWTPEEVLERVRRVNSATPVIIRDPLLTSTAAVRLARLGAYQCLDAAVPLSRVEEFLDAVLDDQRSRRAASSPDDPGAEPWRRWLVGDSRAIREVQQIIRLVASKRCTVLITGETGTGKEMAARALHEAGPRGALPLVAVNCSALPENLLEAELFGHVKGAFTGAVQHRAGRFEQAHRSTLFLDEIGELPLNLQAKLLRVLQEREFQRLGSSETIKVDVRVIAASNVDLLDRVRTGQFREDLYYRLNVVPLNMPPLRRRAGDIPLLVGHFIDKLCRIEQIPPKHIGPEMLQRLCACPWPGNVRELENAVEMALAMSGDRAVLYPSDFPLALPVLAAPPLAAEPALPEGGIDFETAVGRFERAMLEQALDRTGGNKTLAAGLLGLKRTTFLAKIRTLLPPEAL